VVLIAVVVLMNLPVPATLRLKAGARDSFVPVQNVMGFIVSRISDGVVFLAVAKQAVDGRNEMMTELAALRHEARRRHALELENRELRARLKFAARHKHKLVLCRVVSQGGVSGWWQTVRLNRGRADKIRPNLAVIAADGLIGRTMDVSGATTDVLLLTDPNCRIACRFPRSGAFGIARGMGLTVAGTAKLEMVVGAKPCRVDYIEKDLGVGVGDAVVTSGLGGVYPEGLPVGRVVGTEVDSSGLYVRAEVAPAATLSALRYAFVVVQE